MVHLPVLVPFPLLQVWVSLGQGGMVLLKLIFGKGLRRVGAVVGLWMQYSWCWGSWWSCTVCLQVGHWKSNSESIVRRTKGAGSMNLLGFTVTVWHTEQRDPHISKENDKQLAQNMCGVQHFVWTGWSSTSFQTGHIYSCLVFSTNCSG